MNYRLAYTLGFHPWEDAEHHTPFLERFASLLDAEEGGHQSPHGSALDLGCGSGIWGVKLAQRGWQVTGVDNVAKALRRAEQRVREDGVEMQLVEGDVTALSTSGVGSGFRLILDTGTFHGLAPDQRKAMARELTAIAGDDATVLLVAWQPRRRGPFPHGASMAEIERAFDGWNVSDEGPSHFKAPTPIELLLKPDERWYRLRRAPRRSV
jgi:SAM-dependent methyltransferase